MTPLEALGVSRPIPRGGGDTAPPTTSRDDRLLLWAAALFTVAVLVHGADHARRGADALGRDVFWLGTAAIAVEVGVVVLVCQRHRLAALAAAMAGLSLAFGYVAVHFLPRRSWLSDSFTSAVEVSPLSWAAASVEAGAALVLGVVGLVVLRHGAGLSTTGGPTTRAVEVRRAVRHPIALAMIAGNIALLAITMVQIA